MKKIVTIICICLCLCMLFLLTACGGANAESVKAKIRSMNVNPEKYTTCDMTEKVNALSASSSSWEVMAKSDGNFSGWTGSVKEYPQIEVYSSLCLTEDRIDSLERDYKGGVKYEINGDEITITIKSIVSVGFVTNKTIIEKYNAEGYLVSRHVNATKTYSTQGSYFYDVEKIYSNYQ